ncbi:Uncharacterised protein [Mycobacteroides abscessus subsp. abscessus]|nr:Uncharacterised protein [Mycobacteroides abscessus subsp. abscessus]
MSNARPRLGWATFIDSTSSRTRNIGTHSTVSSSGLPLVPCVGGHGFMDPILGQGSFDGDRTMAEGYWWAWKHSPISPGSRNCSRIALAPGCSSSSSTAPRDLPVTSHGSPEYPHRRRARTWPAWRPLSSSPSRRPGGPGAIASPICVSSPRSKLSFRSRRPSARSVWPPWTDGSDCGSHDRATTISREASESTCSQVSSNRTLSPAATASTAPRPRPPIS